MCGICVVLCSLGIDNKEGANNIIQHEIESVQGSIDHRGPDSQTQYLDNDLSLGLYSSVLHIRGNNVVKQPLIDKRQNILLFNGEVYNGINIQPNENDTEKVLQLLTDCSEESIIEKMERVKGEWAFTYIDKDHKQLYFGRDPSGCRSLLMKITQRTIDSKVYYSMTLSSTGYLMDESTELLSDDIIDTKIFDLSTIDPTTFSGPICYLNQWIELPPYGIYSVDLDDYIENHHLYINLHRWKNHYSRLYHEKDIASLTEIYSFPHFPAYLEEAAKILNSHLINSVQRRIFCSSVNQNIISILFSGGIDCSLVAALSCSLLPKDYSIELINISFDQPYYNSPDRRTALNSFIDLKELYPQRDIRFVCVDIPLKEFFEKERHIMNLIYPKSSTMDVHIAAAFYFASRGIGNQIICTDINIDKLKELVDYQKNLNFNESKDGLTEPGYLSLLSPYACSSKIILSGTGADELFGGYIRHYTNYNDGGWKSLNEALQMEYNRLWIRNLGRDDRAISDNGKEIRFPFLDEEVIQFTFNEPIYKLIDPRLSKGEGDKIILRVLCKQYGLKSCIHLSKRAIQFGSRIVKQLNLFEGKSSRQTKGHLKHIMHTGLSLPTN